MFCGLKKYFRQDRTLAVDILTILMKRLLLVYRKAFTASLLLSLSVCANVLHAEERSRASESISGNTKDFLSDPARTGSIVGSIIAGSAIANPLAPILGSVAGFMIGKSSAFNDYDRDAANRRAGRRQSLFPSESLSVPNLSGLSETSPESSDHTVLLGIPVKSSKRDNLEIIEPAARLEQAGTPSHAEFAVMLGSETRADYYHADQAGHTVTLGTGNRPAADFYESEPMSSSPGAGRMEEGGVTGNAMQQKLARECARVDVEKPLSLSCYYFFQ